MKTTVSLLSLSLLFLFTACNKPKEQQAGTPVNFYFSQDSITCTLQAEVAEASLSQAVGEWMNEQLGGYYSGDATDMQAIVDFYGKALCDTLRQDQSNSLTGEMEFDAVMEKTHETSQYVTYSLSTYMDLGGAHPASSDRGATFRKSDGQRLSWDILNADARQLFNDILVEMLSGYIDIDEGADIPLPSTPPYFVEDGVVVIYQEYEIGPYAIGMPTDTIPYERILPLMTDWAQQLISE